ncbi:glycosyltransferase family protein [Romboutsia lituseburensis]|uniref:glycosyltransferase family protein n=1 Tax=Romboutsia lituseburensis TaxID=1537 RepID=UPI0022EA6016|nr:glycosyltransferase family protein [Romboutsia lituseburensis]
MGVLCIIQARLGSTRLPGKVLKKLSGKSVLEHVIYRVSKSDLIDQIIVATTTNKKDDKIIDECLKIGVNYYRGDENNVLSRYYETAVDKGYETIIRITSDCPLIDPKIIDNMIMYFNNENEKYRLDYLSNSLKETFPRGFDVEIFTFNSLKEAYENATLEYEKEHVTPYIYLNQDKFTIKNYYNSNKNQNYRLTLDTYEDYLVIKNIYDNIYKEDSMFFYEDIISYLNQYPEIANINQHIKQKKLGE